GGQAEKATVSIRNVVALCHCQNTLPAQRWLVDDEHANFWPLWQSDMIERAVPAEHFDYSRYWVEPVIALNNQADRDFFASQ
ncbi:hypothetical protein, partial [Pseudomonas aeruginosa]|uniref:hypothetical protein n=1 Tax=Pseudomonas aeruginosa TaxID=287 RepID=UPI002B413151